MEIGGWAREAIKEDESTFLAFGIAEGHLGL
jgi:hypothetical protein